MYQKKAVNASQLPLAGPIVTLPRWEMPHSAKLHVPWLQREPHRQTPPSAPCVIRARMPHFHVQGSRSGTYIHTYIHMYICRILVAVGFWWSPKRTVLIRKHLSNLVFGV